MTPTRQARRLADLARITSAEFARYFRHLATRVERAARSVSEEQLWQKPFPFGNSIGHLILHLTGNLNHYIGSLIAGSGYVRHRDHEFTDPTRYPLEELLARFHQAVDAGRADAGMHRTTRHSSATDDRSAAHSDAVGPFSGMCSAHEQSHRPDELSGPGSEIEHQRTARVVRYFRRKD